MLEARPERRPFVLTRSTYLGGQRYAATWTGDNVADWAHLQWSVPMVLNLGLSGQPNSGPDIGGFAGTPTPELFARWIAMGAFLPFCRTHNSLHGDQEPWSFGPEVEAIARTRPAPALPAPPVSLHPLLRGGDDGPARGRPMFFADPRDPRFATRTTPFCWEATSWSSPALRGGGPRVRRCPHGDWRPFTLAGEDPSRDPAHPSCGFAQAPSCPWARADRRRGGVSKEPLTLLVSLDDTGRAWATSTTTRAKGSAIATATTASRPTRR